MACRSLGTATEELALATSEEFALPPQLTWFGLMSCTGNEASLADCGTPGPVGACPSARSVALRCPPRTRFIGNTVPFDGILEMHKGDEW